MESSSKSERSLKSEENLESQIEDQRKVQRRRTLEFITNNPASFLQNNVLKQSQAVSEEIQDRGNSPSPSNSPLPSALPKSNSDVIVPLDPMPHQKMNSKFIKFPRLKKSDSLSEAVSSLLDSTEPASKKSNLICFFYFILFYFILFYFIFFILVVLHFCLFSQLIVYTLHIW
jgi:hypothetical protein